MDIESEEFLLQAFIDTVFNDPKDARCRIIDGKIS